MSDEVSEPHASTEEPMSGEEASRLIARDAGAHGWAVAVRTDKYLILTRPDSRPLTIALSAGTRQAVMRSIARIRRRPM